MALEICADLPSWRRYLDPALTGASIHATLLNCSLAGGAMQCICHFGGHCRHTVQVVKLGLAPHHPASRAEATGSSISICESSIHGAERP